MAHTINQNIQNKVLIILGCLCLTMGFGQLPVLYANYTANDIRVLYSDEKKLVIEYLPEFPSITTVNLNNQSFASLQVYNCGNLFKEGTPILPSRTLIVGVPNPSVVTAKIIDYQYSDLEGYQVIPAPKFKDKNDGTVEKSYIKDPEIYSRDRFFPDSLFDITEASWLRHQRVVDVNLFPIQYNPVSGRLRVCKKMVVELEFIYASNLQKANRTTLEPVFEDLYTNNVLNYETAKKWRKNIPFKTAKPSFSNSSSWYKLMVENKGIYKLDYPTLKEMGFDSTALNAEYLQIFYGGGRELPRQVSEAVPLFQEVATYFYDDNQDGQLGREDYLLFFAQGISGWDYNSGRKSYSHYINHHTNQNVYWLSIGNGIRKQMQRKNGDKLYSSTPTVVNKYLNRTFHEEESHNSEKSGIEWMWERFNGTMSREFPIQISNLVENDSSRLKIRVQGVTEYHHQLSFFLNDQFLKKIDLPYTLVKKVELDTKDILVDGENVLRIFLYSQGNPKSEFYFDWYELESWRHLKADNDELHFSSSGNQGVLEYHLSGFTSSNINLFDTSSPFDAVKIEKTIVDSSHVFSFQDSVSSISEQNYLAVSTDQYKKVPQILPAQAPHSNLRLTTNAADYVIITHESLNNNALERLASHRRDKRYWPHESDPIIKIVTTEEIYNEFSWGLFDPAAIRNFLKYAYENWRVAPSYVLLVGDACYDPKKNTSGSPTTLLPTFEDQLRATDDWYVCLDGDRKMDMLIGRLPVTDGEELQVVVDKIIQYDTLPQMGPWKNTVLLVADDNYGPSFKYDDFVFGRDTEMLANDSISASFDIKKLYLYQYQRDQFGKKPQMNNDLIQSINQGASYINFLGHGNHEVLTHESIFYTPQDISYLTNGKRLPLFFAGTCAVGQFDYDLKKSMAEELLLHPNGGCISVIAASRWTVHQMTFIINQEFYSRILRQSEAQSMTIGQALVAAKLQSRYPDHRELLILFGDPAQKLNIPQHSINFAASPDSLSLTKNVQINGVVEKDKKLMSNFSGSLFVKLYDSFFKRYATGYSYLAPGRVLFADTLTVDDGIINSNFFLHADTTAGGKQGRFVAYAWQKENNPGFIPGDAAGFLNSQYIISDTLTAETHIDSLAPRVEVDISGLSVFPSENIAVPPSFTINFYTSDENSGINVGRKHGYEITIQLDDGPEDIYDVTSDFIFEQGSKKSGSVAYQFEDLSVGTHQIFFSIWDNSLNNSTIQVLVVVEPKELQIKDPLNYPNPASSHTSFTFTLTHDAEITIKLYTVVGRLIKVFQTYATRGFNSFPEEGWDCTDQDGDFLANGVYLYKIIANKVLSPYRSGDDFQNVESIGRMIVMR
jgi:hypothetical protein